MVQKVRVGSTYIFNPVLFDQLNKPFGQIEGLLNPGDKVKVINKYGCPKANTMNMCYIEKEGKFVGMVMVYSLKEINEKVI